MRYLSIGYDPIELGYLVERRVCRNLGSRVVRRYYRFRGGRWYGGIATGDVVGCNLRCRFCWSWRSGSYVTDTGVFKSPEEVASILRGIARRRRYSQVRLSGGEPTLCFDHLTQVIEEIPNRLTFIIETNGLLLGVKPELVRKLSRFENLVVRVAIKGTSPEEFNRLTGAKPEYFEAQIKALENLLREGFEPGKEFYPAVMLSFSTSENIKSLLERLASIHPLLPHEIDPEFVILYPHVKELLRRFKLKPLKAYDPTGVPDYMI